MATERLSDTLAIHGGEPIRTKPFPARLHIGKEEWDAVRRVFRQAMRSGGGFDRYGTEDVDLYEKEFARAHGVKHATAVSSGTAAVHTALSALRLPPGKEIICNTITDPGPVAPILWNNCIPVFAEQELEKRRRKSPDATMDEVKAAYGKYYRDTMAHTREVLGNLKTYFPDYGGEGYEVAGMVWFQGWNDMGRLADGNYYTPYLAHFIRDVRKKLGAPDMPVVVGETGQGGEIEDESKGGGKLLLRNAQAAVARVPDLKGTVTFVKTAGFHDPRIAEICVVYNECKHAVYLERKRQAKEAGEPDHRKIKLDDATIEKLWEPWAQVEPEWEKVGGDQGYHFFGSGKLFYQMGDAFGKAMVELLEE